jgi:adenine-specific DNA-methyltransferase
MQIDFSHPYLTKQIIAYIGNKRRLLPLIHRAIEKCYHPLPQGIGFCDPFSGSGVVSRFARHLNFEVYTNDWEPYTFTINKAYLEINERDLHSMYTEFGGLESILKTLNTLPSPKPEEQYIARYYSPSTHETDGLDFRRERMFYTRYNGLMIDKIRNGIETVYPEKTVQSDARKKKEKYLLIALLLYEAATHTNTSGVFKAYHKGFGGHNADALKRILAPIELKRPVLINSQYPAHVYMTDANELVERVKACNCNIDVVYLDPPYNQHQYGSNYHLLNTIALWDRLPVDNGLNDSGILKEKAGIRKDWVKTKSDFCYREKAAGAFHELLRRIDASFILLSYSTEGIIPFEELKKMCAEKGMLDIVTNEYVKYRGGKQSIDRLNKNIEFVMIIDTQNKSKQWALKKLDYILSMKELALLFSKRYSHRRLEKYFHVNRQEKSIRLEQFLWSISTRSFFELIPPPEVEKMEYEDIQLLIDRLEKSVCRDKEEELEEIMEKIYGDKSPLYFVKLLPGTLRKFAHKKYKNTFLSWLERIKNLQKDYPDMYDEIEHKINELEALAEKRFTH